MPLTGCARVSAGSPHHRAITIGGARVDTSRPGTCHGTASINDVLVEVDLVRRGVRESHRRLHRAASLLDEQRMREPSQLPGWTRDHLRTHLARNTDSVVRRLQAASQGEASTSTPSRAGRAREIERGADRPFGKIVADLHAADDALDTLDLPSDTWSGKVRRGSGDTSVVLSAAKFLWSRWREIEVHHRDLGLGHSIQD